jgi:hypothetical protein
VHQPARQQAVVQRSRRNGRNSDPVNQNQRLYQASGGKLPEVFPSWCISAIRHIRNAQAPYLTKPIMPETT